MCLNTCEGGLGVKSFATLNKALLGKWMWHFANEIEAFWNQVIRGNYGEDRGGWCSHEEVREGHGVGLWKAIRKLSHLGSSRNSFVVGNGQRVSFWKDKWCGTSPLCVSFTSLFALAVAKEAWLSDLWTVSASGERRGSWNPHFNRHFNDWELDDVENLLGRLCGEKVMLDEKDRVRWLPSKDGNFWVQPKISLFVWEASWGKALTLDQIQKKGWALGNRCFLCQVCEETIDHLLLHCERTREV